jgi:hypothetical protein
MTSMPIPTAIPAMVPVERPPLLPPSFLLLSALEVCELGLLELAVEASAEVRSLLLLEELDETAVGSRPGFCCGGGKDWLVDFAALVPGVLNDEAAAVMLGLV